MSHGTSHHPQLLKYSSHFESSKVQEVAFTMVCIFSGKNAAKLGWLSFWANRVNLILHCYLSLLIIDGGKP